MCVVTQVSIQRYKDTLECSWWFSDFLGDQSLFITGGGGWGVVRKIFSLEGEIEFVKGKRRGGGVSRRQQSMKGK